MTRQIINRLKVLFSSHLRSLNASILTRWILYFKSQPLLPNGKSAMVFSPHQDDETLGCGGMIALKRSQNIPVEVVFLTDGRYGRPDWIAPENIIEVRRQEAFDALAILGVTNSHIHFLDQVDASLQHLSHLQRQGLIDNLVERLQSFQPQEVYVPHRKDVHRDHEATYKLVEEAIAKSGLKIEIFQYPIWMLWQKPLSSDLKSQEIASAYSLAINSVHNQKKQAIATYRSQHSGLSSSFLERFSLPGEIFFKN